MSDHAHDHGAHPPRQDGAEAAYYEKLTWALHTLLVDKGLITAEEIRATIEDTDARTPALGAQVVARAWVDPAYKARLLANARQAIAELGIDTGTSPVIVAVENTDTVHNLVVCTLCSCYPRALLGRPPDWYKSLNYRARAVVDPRGVLKEFGLELGPEVEVRVYDSTADMRYLVIPQRPAGTEGWSEAELATLVTRDSMIGVARARQPGVRQAAAAPSATA
jgi:nitrile hydratase